jgi:hypothetical protein
MRAYRWVIRLAVVAIAVLGAGVSPAHAQGKGRMKHYAVTTDRAVSVTRTVLIDRGYNVVRIERVGPTQVVYYRLKKNKHSKAVGPVQRIVIRTVRDRVVFEDAEPSVLVDIDVRLKI